VFSEDVTPIGGYKKGLGRETFPTKENRQYQVPLLYPPNTWMIDVMFSQLPGG
jgi:hypothetical protein